MTAGNRQVRVLSLGMGWFPDQPGGLTRYHRDLHVALTSQAAEPPRAVVVGPVAAPPAGVRPVSAQDAPLPLRLARFAAAVRVEAHRDAIEVLDAHFALYAFPCLLVPSLRRFPFVVHFHGPWADEFVANRSRPSWRINLMRRLERSVYRHAAAFVVLSNAFKQILVERFAIDAAKVHVLGGAVDVDRFTPGDRAAARAALDVPDGAWVAVTARRLDPRMGIDTLIDAWAQLEDPSRLLLVVSDGPERGALEARASAAGIESMVRFLGRVSDDDLIAAYRAADVSVVPSHALEGFGLVVLEAMACGTPVIGTTVGGLGETLRRVDPGLAVPPGDSDALAARLAGARTGAAPLPPAADCRRFAEGYSWAALAERHWQVYADVIAASR
jgi:glycosyltransferase involved in cell wall biosynthesis